MIYILATYDERGLKIPRQVTLQEAQDYYSTKCHLKGLDPGDLSTLTESACFTDLHFDDLLWVIKEPTQTPTLDPEVIDTGI